MTDRVMLAVAPERLIAAEGIGVVDRALAVCERMWPVSSSAETDSTTLV